MRPETRELIKNSIDQNSKGKSEADKCKAEELMTKIVEEGMSAKEAMGLSDEFLEKLYSDAYNLFQSGNYEKAEGIFRLLMIFNPSDARYPMGVASCFHRLNKYMEAVAFYNLTCELDNNNALPYFYASDCFMKSYNDPAALLMLQEALKRLKETPENSALRTKIEQSILALEEEREQALSRVKETL